MLLVALALFLMSIPALTGNNQFSRTLLVDSTCASGWNKKAACAQKDGMWQCGKKKICLRSARRSAPFRSTAATAA
jgi:hypothetical protein